MCVCVFFFRWLNTSSTGFYSIYVFSFVSVDFGCVNEETYYFHVKKKNIRILRNKDV